MDQTTETADLTETEKYLLSASCSTNTGDSSDSSDIDDDDVATTGLLGGIRGGLKTMTKTANSALSTCKNKNELDDAIGKIQASSLKLLKLEKSFLKTAAIVSEVVDDLVSDFEEEDDGQPECLCGEKFSKTSEKDVNGGKKRASAKEEVKFGSGDAKVGASSKLKATQRQQPYVFSPSKSNLVSFERFKDKLKTEYHKRMEEYKESLTDEFLKEDLKFEALLEQIKKGKKAAETTMSNEQKDTEEKVEENEGRGSSGQNKTEQKGFPVASKVFSKEELQSYRYKPYNENDDMDHSVLPTLDPISKELIMYPVKNKFCNHVFDRASIYSFIAGNPNATCPVHMCRNQRKLERIHFISDPVLTSHIRQKNNFENI